MNLNSAPLIAVSNDMLNNEFNNAATHTVIHLDERYYIGEDMTLFKLALDANGNCLVGGNVMHFGDPDQCLDYIILHESRNIYITFSDKFSYLLPVINDMPQIVWIYIYSVSPEEVPYTSAHYSKLRAIVKEDSPNMDTPLMTDIATFLEKRITVDTINPVRPKTKLLIQEPLIAEEYMIIWIDDSDTSTCFERKCITDIIERLDIFFEAQHCIESVQSLAENTQVFLILSHSDSDRVINEISHLPNIINIYLIDTRRQIEMNMNDSTVKVRGIYGNLESLGKQLYDDYKNLKHSSPLSTSVFHRESNETTIRDLSKESARFLWQQLLIDILIK